MNRFYKLATGKWIYGETDAMQHSSGHLFSFNVGFTILLLCVLAASTAFSQGSDGKTLFISREDVFSDSIYFTEIGATNVQFHFKFSKKSSDDIKQLVRLYAGHHAEIQSDGVASCKGRVVGGVFQGDRMVGLMLVFSSRDIAVRARFCLSSNISSQLEMPTPTQKMKTN